MTMWHSEARAGKMAIGALVLCVAFSLFAEGAAIRFTSAPTVLANPNPAVPLAAILSFKTETPVATRIEIAHGDGCRVLEYGFGTDPEKGLPLVGFVPGIRHQIRVVVSNAEGESATAIAEFTAPDLPVAAEEFPVIEIKRPSDAPMEPGITIFNPRRRFPRGRLGKEQADRLNQGFGMLVAVDAGGNVVWYYRSNSRISDFELLRNGNILFLTQDYRAVEIDLLGNTVAQWYAGHRPQGVANDAVPVDTLTFHHDIDELPNGNFLVLGSERRRVAGYYTSELEKQAPRKDQWVMGDELVEFRRDGTVVWRWNAFDHLDVWRMGYETFSGYWERRGFPGTVDWSHANAVVPLDDGALLVNFRYQSAIVKIDRKTGNILWIAGEPSGWGEGLRKKLLKMEGGAQWFWHQHGPSITPEGNLLLFDNGNFQARPFDPATPPAKTRSRMVEYALGQEGLSLEERWTSVRRNDPPVVSFAMGSTQYLPQTGNLLAGYGFLLSQEDLRDRTWHTLAQSRVWTRVREYTHEPEPQVVWELVLRACDNDFGLGWNLFGARRVPHFPLPGTAASQGKPPLR